MVKPRIIKAKPEDFEEVFRLLVGLYQKDKLTKTKTKGIFLRYLKDKDKF